MSRASTPSAGQRGVSSGYRFPLQATAVACSLYALSLGAAHAQQAEGSLSEVVVSASGFEQDIKKAPASITVVSREALETKRASSLAEALADVEGVDVGNDVGKTGGMNISIRGMPSDYTLVLVDGRRQNAAGNVTPNGFGETSTSFLPPISAIERIEVIRGPMATLYGSDAMGGVINIITRKVGKTWAGAVNLNGTVQENRDRGDSLGTNVYLSGPIKQDMLGLTLRASSFKRSASELEPTGNAGNTTISTRGPSPVKADIDTLGARLTLTPNRDHEIYLDLDTARQVYDNSSAQLGTLGVQGYTAKQKFNREQTVLAYNANLGFGKLETSLTRNETETIGRTIPSGTPGKAPGSARTLTAENTILDAKLITAVGESHLLTVGAQYWDAEMIDGVAPAPYTHTQWALFGEDEWRLTPALALTLGARYDDHSQFGAQFSPRIYTVWDATDNWIVKGGVSRGFKTPRLDQLADGITGFTGQGTRPTIGTPSLKPETSTSYELGTMFDDKKGFTIGGTIFFNQFKDKIATGSGLLNCSFAGAPNRPGCVNYGNWPAVDTYGQSVNVDEAETRGFELSTRVPLAKGLNASGNYTFTRSEQKSGASAGQPLYNTPKHMLNAKLDWKIDEKFSTWVSAEYRSSRWRDDTSATGRAARAVLGDYKATTQFHLGGSYRLNKSVTLGATIYNLFDKDFLEYAQYAPNAYAARYNNMLEGRRLWLTANVTF
jgi:outer membrane receptor for ferrienterochelin and colicins